MHFDIYNSIGTGIDFGRQGGSAALGLTLEELKCLAPSVFWQTMPTWHSRQIRVFDRKPQNLDLIKLLQKTNMHTRNLKDLDCTRMQQRPVLFCFWSTSEIGSNFRNAQLE